jgi:hypothetical protein
VQIVPLSAVPSQTVTVVLAGQECIIHVYQRSTGLYLDLTITGTLILAGVICQDRNLLVINAYLGLIGDLVFIDTLGTSDPSYSGLGARWLLAYLLPAEILPIALSTTATLPTIAVPGPTPTPTPVPTPTPTPPPTSTPGAPTGVTIS